MNEENRIYESELKVLEIIWEFQPITAKEISVIAHDRINWNKNTTYTIIKKLINKGAIRRDEPNFQCTSLVQKSDFQKVSIDNLISKLFDGDRSEFFKAFDKRELTADDKKVLQSLLD
ncbi:MAG: BlaI/MecI/CopY family transcriptional regulator [Erysipelotrichaceae bacterium]